MATHHADPGELVDLEDWANDLPGEHTKVVVKTDKMELVRLYLPSKKIIPEHKVSGPIIIHCLSGSIIFSTEENENLLSVNQLLFLKPGELHSLRAIEDSVVLLTIIFTE